MERERLQSQESQSDHSDVEEIESASSESEHSSSRYDSDRAFTLIFPTPRSNRTSKKTVKRDNEAYRKFKLCPYIGCHAFGKPLKKLAQHIKVQHPKVSTEERLRVTRTAKVVSRSDVLSFKAKKDVSAIARQVTR